MLPPVLEIYVVWHPRDSGGADFANDVLEHFHGTLYSGLIGGAVEVYHRSEGWLSRSGAPRPIPFTDTAPPFPDPIPARYVAVVPVVALGLARAVEEGGAWAGFVEEIAAERARNPERTFVFPVAINGAAISGGRLDALLGSIQRLAAGYSGDEPLRELRLRELAQSLAQGLSVGPTARLKVFVSHTNRGGPGEPGVEGIVQLVRQVIATSTRLGEFLDAHDLQPGRDWAQDLQAEASNGMLLAVRTDLYSTREWCQREVLVAKRAGLPVVILDALGRGEERGSFLMDHVPRMPLRQAEAGWSRADVRRCLNVLVDEALKRTLWRCQQQLATEAGGDFGVQWWAPHAPEPATLLAWLKANPVAGGASTELRVLHPDPPLGPDERQVLEDMARLAGARDGIDVLTPRGLAARGG